MAMYSVELSRTVRLERTQSCLVDVEASDPAEAKQKAIDQAEMDFCEWLYDDDFSDLEEGRDDIDDVKVTKVTPWLPEQLTVNLAIEQLIGLRDKGHGDDAVELRDLEFQVITIVPAPTA
jgi:hypothetical protein